MLQVTPSPSLRELTTLRLGGRALAEIRFDAEADTEELARRLGELGGRPCALGAGSNILAEDGELPLVLVRPQCESELLVIEEKKNAVTVRAGAGLPLPRLLGRCAAWGLSGLEGLAGIPGTVGGAVAMNAGSFGCETGRVLCGLRIWTPERGVEELYPGQWNFAYRLFVLTRKAVFFLILSASFCLTRASSNGIRETMRLNYFKKKSTQPLTAWSAGCAFKNPPGGQAAGKLLDDAGFKGKRLGGMAFSPLHANFLINEGTGSSAAAFDLLAEARETVLRKNGIELETEIRVLSCRCD